MIALIAGLRQYDAALLGRFGREAIPADVDLQQAISSFALEPVMRIEHGIVKEAAETAEVDPALNGIRLSARPPIFLRKEKEQWKVDLLAMRGDPQFAPEVVAQYLAAGKALQQAARDIRAGRYKTFAEAQNPMTDGMPGHK